MHLSVQNLPTIATWYLPTTFGDIRLVSDGKQTRIELCKLTRAELDAVTKLRDHSIAPGLLRTPWATTKDWTKLPGAFETGRAERSTIVLDAPVAKIERFLTRLLRKDRRVISVVSTKPGEYIDITAAYDDDGNGSSPYRAEGDAAAEKSKPKPEKAAAVTVAAPVRGCPAPDFADAHMRASEVLRAFLTPDQVADFERHQQFVTVGGATGHRYAITSRHCRSKLLRAHRTVFDLDENQEMCVHDWDIPAAEEMLTMHLLLSMPHYEPWMRGMPDLDFAAARGF